MSSSTQPTASGTDGRTDQSTQPQQQLNRSCESCRSLKVRCIPDQNVPNQCQRCTRAKRPCIFVAPQKRRPRRRTDSRVAQLEREMAAMRSMLRDRNLPIGELTNEESETGNEEAEDVDFNDQGQLSHDSDTASKVQNRCLSPGQWHGQDASRSEGSAWGPNTPSLTQNIISGESWDEDDVIDRGVVSVDMASELISLFIHKLAKFFPVIVLPEQTSAAQLRRTRPVLFLTVLASASIAVDSKLAAALNGELINSLAVRFFFRHEKSLDLILALIMMVVFHPPPESPSESQIFQYTHIAATMALEIGIASKRRVSRRPVEGKRAAQTRPSFDHRVAEQARAALACYHLASNVAIKTRRPSMLVYNDWIQECVRILSRSPINSDRQFALWFGLQRITDETLHAFGVDETSSTAPLTENRVRSVLRLFDKRIEDWRKGVDSEHFTVFMALEYHFTILAVYGVGAGEGCHDIHAVDDEPTGCSEETLSTFRVDLLLRWLDTSHALLDSFLSCDIHTMRQMPSLAYYRVTMGVIVLLKVLRSAQSGGLGEVLSPESVRMETYLDAITQKLTEASGNSQYIIPTLWLKIIGAKWRDFYRTFPSNQTTNKTASPQPQPQTQPTQVSPSESHSVTSPSTTTESSFPVWHSGILPFATRMYHEAASTPGSDDQHSSLSPSMQSQLSDSKMGYAVSPASAPAANSPMQGGWHPPGLGTPSHGGEGTMYDQHAAGSQIQHPWPQQTTGQVTPHPFPVDPNQALRMYPADNMPMNMEFDWVPEGGTYQFFDF